MIYPPDQTYPIECCNPRLDKRPWFKERKSFFARLPKRFVAGHGKARLLRHFLFLLLVFEGLTLKAQTVATYRRLSKAERHWVIGHLFVAKRAYRVSLEARDRATRLESDPRLDHDKDGGEVDAFRHAYWMARLTQAIGKKKALKLGEAHERGNYQDYLEGRVEETHLPDSMASVMDRWNNRLGASVGEGCMSFSQDQLQERIIDEILQGRARKLLKSESGDPLDCSGKRIDRTQKAWRRETCLISTGRR